MRGKTHSIGLRAVLAVFALTLFAAETAASQEKVLYSFYNSGGAVLPVAGVISDASGNLYGTAFYGGTYDNGMVFELTPTATGRVAPLHGRELVGESVAFLQPEQRRRTLSQWRRDHRWLRQSLRRDGRGRR